MNTLTQIALILTLFLSSCLSHKTIIRNYQLSKDEHCDCITRKPLILIGSRSNYFLKEKAICTNLNFGNRRDSIDYLNALKSNLEDQLYDSYISKDSLNRKREETDSLLKDLKNDWTHLRIKTKWKPAYKDEEKVILKQKVKYFNKFHKGRGFIGKKIVLNDSIVKSTF